MAKIDVDSIKPLPERLYKQFYGESYDPKTWKLRFSGLSDSEKITLKAYLKVQDAKEIYWVPEVNSPDGVHTADLWVDGVVVEIKNATTARSVADQMAKASRQVGETGVVLINHNGSSLSRKEFLAEVERRAAMNGIKTFAAVQGEKVSTYKKDIAEPQRSRHDPAISYSSILPQSGEKVKTLDKLFAEETATTSKTTPVKSQKTAKTANFSQKITKNPQNGKSVSLKSDIYWQKRAKQRLTETEKAANPYLRSIKAVYEDSAKSVVESVREMYRAYYNRHEKTFDIPTLEKIAARGDIKQFKAEMKAAGLSTYLPDSYKGRMTRLELLEAQMWGEVKKTAKMENTVSSNSYRKTIQDGYYGTIYDTAKGTELNLAFSKLDTRKVEKILQTKFYGKNYSARIWNNTDRLANSLQEILGRATATGQGQAKTVREIQERFNVSKYNVARLVRTETAYFETLSTAEAYAAMGVKKFEFHATKDGRTCDEKGLCRDLDGAKFDLKELKPGKNAPPLHPHCRCYITAYLGEEWEPTEMRARNPETGEGYVTKNMTYKKWLKEVTKENRKMRGTTSWIISKIGVTSDYWKNKMEPSERAFARSYALDHDIEWIDRFSRKDVKTGKILETNDYKEDGEEWELKTPTGKLKYSSVARIISEAAKSGYKKNFMINLGKRGVSETLITQLAKYNERHGMKILKLRLYSKGKVIEVELKK